MHSALCDILAFNLRVRAMSGEPAPRFPPTPPPTPPPPPLLPPRVDPGTGRVWPPVAVAVSATPSPGACCGAAPAASSGGAGGAPGPGNAKERRQQTFQDHFSGKINDFKETVTTGFDNLTTHISTSNENLNIKVLESGAKIDDVKETMTAGFENLLKKINTSNENWNRLVQSEEKCISLQAQLQAYTKANCDYAEESRGLKRELAEKDAKIRRLETLGCFSFRLHVHAHGSPWCETSNWSLL